MFKVEKNIPVAEVKYTEEIYPFSSLEIGDSFFVPYDGNDPNYIRRKVFSASCQAGKRHGKKYTGRKLEHGIRVWRIA